MVQLTRKRVLLVLPKLLPELIVVVIVCGLLFLLLVKWFRWLSIVLSSLARVIVDINWKRKQR